MLDLALIYSYFHVEVHMYNLFWVDKSYILVRTEGKYDFGVKNMGNLLVWW